MAITDVEVFTHLTDADIENLGVELDAIRQDIEDSRGERDARYIRRTIAAQRALEVAARVLLAASSRRSAWWAGTAALGVAKIIENMEIGHNVMHGQWDWMNDPEIHSSTWEWDMSGSSKHWRYTHNFRAPQVHQHPRDGRRRRLRHAARHPRPALEALQHLQPGVEHAARAAL